MNFRRAIGILLVSFLAPGLAVAQLAHVSSNSRFSVDQIKGCTPLTVNVEINNAIVPCSNMKQCFVNFELTNLTASCNTAFTSPPEILTSLQNQTVSHVFNTAGKYKLTILYNDETCDDIVIEVLPNIKPTFELYYCNADKVFVNITDKTYPSYIINYNDAQPEVAVTGGNNATNIHNFSAGGQKKVSVRGLYDVTGSTNVADNCLSADDTIKIRPIPSPGITQLEAIDPAAIKLDFITQDHVLYKLQIASNNNTTFQQLQNVYNTNTVTIGSVKPDDLYYCFQMGKSDPCLNTTTFNSNKICSANVDVVAKSNQDDLSWITSSAGIIDYTITRNTTPLSPNVPSSATSKTDVDIVCNTDYTYQLISNYTGAKSISLPKKVTSISNDIPKALENISAAVHESGTGVDLNWPVGELPKEYTIYRSAGAYSAIGTTATEAFTDDAYTTAGSFCYEIKYKNTCGNESLTSIEACPIRLTGQLQKDNSIVLSWSAYTGWTNAVGSYTVEKYSTSGQLLRTFIAGAATSLTDNEEDLNNQTYRYVVKATATDGTLEPSISNIITIIKQPNLYYPGAFTPDGQGPSQNEVFKVFGQFVNQFEMKIFNRWGELMFSTEDIKQGWDGNYKGNPMPEGTYAFIANLTDEAGRTFKRSGSVVLLRKK